MDALLTSPDMIYVIYTALALGIFLLFTGVIQVLSRGENPSEVRNRRMRMIAKGPPPPNCLPSSSRTRNPAF